MTVFPLTTEIAQFLFKLLIVHISATLYYYIARSRTANRPEKRLSDQHRDSCRYEMMSFFMSCVETVVAKPSGARNKAPFHPKAFSWIT